MTTPATDPNKLTDLAITINSKSLLVTCNSANCAFSYQNSLTPFIEEIIPRSVVGGDKVYVYGQHRITQLGDGRSTSGTQIKNLVIGDRECTTTDIIQGVNGFDPNSRSSIECRADPTQPAG